MTTDVTTPASEVDEALAEVSSLTDEIDETKQKLDDLYARQKEQFVRCRGFTPPVTNRRIAEAARISEEAVIQRLRPPKAKATKSTRARAS